MVKLLCLVVGIVCGMVINLIYHHFKDPPESLTGYYEDEKEHYQ